MRTKFSWLLFIGGLCITNALLWLSFKPVPWQAIEVSGIVGVVLTSIGIYERQEELRSKQ